MPPSQDMGVDKAQARGPQRFHTIYTFQDPPTFRVSKPGSQKEILLGVEDAADVLREVAEERATSGHDVFTDIIQINEGVVKTFWDPSPYMPGTTTPTGEDIEISADVVALRPRATTTTRTKKVQFAPKNPAEFMADIRRILIQSPSPPTAYRCSTTVYWEWKITTTTAPCYGTWTEYELWLVVQREVHMEPGHEFTLDSTTLERDKYLKMTTYTWIHANDPEAGGSYGGEHMKKNSNMSDCFIDNLLKPKRRMERGSNC